MRLDTGRARLAGVIVPGANGQDGECVQHGQPGKGGVAEGKVLDACPFPQAVDQAGASEGGHHATRDDQGHGAGLQRGGQAVRGGKAREVGHGDVQPQQCMRDDQQPERAVLHGQVAGDAGQGQWQCCCQKDALAAMAAHQSRHWQRGQHHHQELAPIGQGGHPRLRGHHGAHQGSDGDSHHGRGQVDGLGDEVQPRAGGQASGHGVCRMKASRWDVRSMTG